MQQKVNALSEHHPQTASFVPQNAAVSVHVSTALNSHIAVGASTAPLAQAAVLQGITPDLWSEAANALQGPILRTMGAVDLDARRPVL